MPLYEKIKRGKVTSPCTLTMMTSYTSKCQIFGFDIGQEEIELLGKIIYFYTAKQNCLEADRLEINI